ncbi:MAG TPA: ABC transporter ATP-binding protein [Bryobacteraceae bacterium]|nr:ABC transporter ATP-binding protein [Bryobacteraceae bacterium]
MQPVIETEKLSRRFGPVCAVESVDLHTEPGAVYAFLGANGAGKTTTIRMLLGLIRPDAGAVRLFGEPFRRSALARVGSLVESPSLYPHLTGRENLEVIRRMVGGSTSDIARALDSVRLSDAADRLVSGYSLGMRQRLGLGLALFGAPDLLVLDEPTNGLDPAGIREVRELVAALPAERGITVFLSSHLLAEVENVATHVGIIDRGRMLFEGPLASLQARTQSRLEIRTERADDAARALRSAEIPADRHNGDGIVVSGADAETAARANALLVARGFAVYQLHLRAPSLEEIFLAVTSKKRENETCAAF